MSGMEPFLMAIGKGAAGAAGGMAVNKAGEAAFGGNAENAMQPGMPGGGPQQGGGPAMQILAGLQQQMQQEEMMRQQAIASLLAQFSQPMGMMPQRGAVQMES